MTTTVITHAEENIARAHRRGRRNQTRKQHQARRRRYNPSTHAQNTSHIHNVSKSKEKGTDQTIGIWAGAPGGTAEEGPTAGRAGTAGTGARGAARDTPPAFGCASADAEGGAGRARAA